MYGYKGWIYIHYTKNEARQDVRDRSTWGRRARIPSASAARVAGAAVAPTPRTARLGDVELGGGCEPLA